MSFELKTHTAIINIIIAARKLKYCLHDIILIIITIVTAWVYTNAQSSSIILWTLC